jgi:hypothetical protein
MKELTYEQKKVVSVLKSDHTNVFERHRAMNDKIWMKMDFSKVRIVDMSKLHIRNCIEMLEKGEQTHTMAYHGLVEELRKRK